MVRVGFAIILTAIILLFGCNLFDGAYRLNEKPFTVSDEWFEIVPQQPVACDRVNQQVLINIATPYEVEHSGPDSPKIVLQDGTTPIMECELIGVDKTVYAYRSAGLLYRGDDRYKMFDEQGPMSRKARERSYRGVRLRSSRPIVISEVTLQCDNAGA